MTACGQLQDHTILPTSLRSVKYTSASEAKPIRTKAVYTHHEQMQELLAIFILDRTGSAVQKKFQGAFNCAPIKSVNGEMHRCYIPISDNMLWYCR